MLNAHIPYSHDAAITDSLTDAYIDILSLVRALRLTFFWFLRVHVYLSVHLAMLCTPPLSLLVASVERESGYERARKVCLGEHSEVGVIYE